MNTGKVDYMNLKSFNELTTEDKLMEWSTESRLPKDRLVKGNILGFDELNDDGAPSKKLALLETFELDDIG